MILRVQEEVDVKLKKYLDGTIEFKGDLVLGKEWLTMKNFMLRERV